MDKPIKSHQGFTCVLDTDDSLALPIDTAYLRKYKKNKRPEREPKPVIDVEIEADTRINWFAIFNDLKLGGWSLYRIEAEMDIAKSTLLGWKSGAEPRHADGEMLISLWQAVTSKARESLPIEKRFANAYHRK